MKFYIAARTSQIAKVKEIIDVLKQKGQDISYDWTAVENADLSRPYGPHSVIVADFAKKEIAGILDADVFIILSDPSGTGMYVEMGIALAGNSKIYSIGDHNEVTVFHFHPKVKRLTNLEEVFTDLNI